MPSAETLNRSGPRSINSWTLPRTAWLLFGPVAFLVAVRWLLSLHPVVTTAGTLLELFRRVALTLALQLASGRFVTGWQATLSPPH